MKKRINPYINKASILLTMLLLITGCSETGTEQTQDTAHHKSDMNEVELSAEQFKIAEISYEKITDKTLSSVLNVNGVMDAPPQSLISISAPLGGFVVKTDLLQGMKVKRGQLLVTMEHPDYVQLQQDFIDKKSQLVYLEQEYKRQGELNKENVNSAKVYQQVTAEYMSMKAQVKGLKEKLLMIGVNTENLTEANLSGRINIYSPINGYVSEVNVNIGKYVNPTDVMFEIVDTEHLHVELTVYEKDVSKLKIGQKIRFTLPNDNSVERLASVHLIGRKIDANRSVRVHGHLEHEDHDLLPGMYVNALIEVSENKAKAIPQEAIVTLGGNHFVFVFKGMQQENDLENYLFEKVEVQKGVTQAGYTEVTFLNTANFDTALIVTKGAFSLLSKMENTDEEDGGH